VATALTGALHDTGQGYPALGAGADAVPGWTVTLRSPASALPELDDYEGPEYRRMRAVDATGRLCWTYLWTAGMGGLRPLPGGWAD
jgi:gamma-glutamylcyclotransferase (GGCT)/AIG2-like uncharacterized protein YtfP